jgi:hypothetical protein
MRLIGFSLSLLVLLDMHRAVAVDFSSDNIALESDGAEPFSLEEIFTRGNHEARLSSGVLFSPFGTPKSRPTINYTITGLEWGYMLSEMKGAGWLRGNFEVAGQAFGSAVFTGPGHYIAGATLWLRYNFVPKGWRFIPYIQGGAGITFTDIDRGIVGQDFNFNLDLGCGIRYFLARQWSLNLEYQYQHISNADLGGHNLGINSQGPVLALSYFF